MRVAQLVLDIPTQALDAAFTYSVPDALSSQVHVGCAVVVEFGVQQSIAFVIAVDDEAAPDIKLKPILSVESKPYFNEAAVACAQAIAHRYIAPLSSCIRLFVPAGAVPKMKKTAGHWSVVHPEIARVDDRWALLGPCAHDFVPRKGAFKQEAVLAALRNGALRVSELTAEYGSIHAVLKTLESKGVIRIEQRRRMRNEAVNQMQLSLPQATAIPVLTSEQQNALDAINEAIAAHTGNVVLVHGVTGSGKTEVYLRAIEQVLKQGKNAVVLVPEIALTPQTVARFRGRFGELVAVMHSRMSQGERYDQWDFIRSGAARVVVGARSALFTPLDNVGIYVIDEEHETSYKQDSAPRYHARDVAAWLAQQHGACLVLGSATPSLESIYECRVNPAWHYVQLSQRANGKEMPRITTVNMAQEFAAGHKSMFSRPLIAALKRELGAQHKVVLFLNQRGFAKFLLCRDCGYVPECPSCSVSLTYHEAGNMLMCHHCGHVQAAPAVCPQCKSPYLRMFGAGTQRVEAELRKLLAQLEGELGAVRVIRMDADTTKTKGAHLALLEEFAQSGAAVLLGTQMIAKGLDFDDVTLVGVINADTMLHLPDYRSEERTFDLVEQVAGRAGRAQLQGEVIVQSYDPSVAALRFAERYDAQGFIEDQLAKREPLKYPPFSRMANILLWGPDERAVRVAARDLFDDLSRHIYGETHGTLYESLYETASTSEITLMPATPCLLERLKGNYRWHIVLSCPRNTSPAQLLEPFFRGRKTIKNVRVSVDIDPQSLL